MAEPLAVSVVVPVWNTEPWLMQCLDSVAAQTIGTDRVELIAVDDGSTDGSAAMLDAHAATRPWMRVVHQSNSGGPGGPRNRGIDLARGTYVHFVDADDFLGPETLERMVAMAERNGSDIVIGEIVPIEGRARHRRVLGRRNVDRAELELVSMHQSVLKLFRRSFVVRNDLRFPEGVPLGEDGDFMGRAYAAAGTISILAEYDCYFLRRRAGSQTTRTDRTVDLLGAIARLEADRLEPVAHTRRPGLHRDVLIALQLKRLMARFRRPWLRLPPDERRAAFDAGAGIVQRWSNARILHLLPARAAVRAYCLEHGLFHELEDIAACSQSAAYRAAIEDRGRIYARYPHFRDRSGIPDACFDITREISLEQTLTRADVKNGRLELAGEAYLRRVGGNTTIDLRRWPFGRVVRFPATPVPTPELRDAVVSYPMAGFTAVIDLATAATGQPLPRGVWAIDLSVGTDAVRRTRPLRLRAGVAAGVVLQQRGDRAARLRVAAGRSVRLEVGQPNRAVVFLMRAEMGASSVARLGLRAVERTLERTRAGRLVLASLSVYRPELARRVFDD